MEEETMKCPSCGGVMRLYKTDDTPEVETENHRKGYIIYEYEHEVVRRHKATFYECEVCHSILKKSLLQRVIFLKKDKV